MMMNENFRFIKKNVDVSKILEQLLDNPKDWQAVSTYANIGGLVYPYGFLPLVMGRVKNPSDNIKDSNLQQRTPLYDKYNEVKKFLKSQGIKSTSRAGFFKLEPGGKVGRHIDDGNYYLTKDRYHLSIQGTYLYEVDGETYQIEPGTFFWFNNKKFHSADNNGTIDRITFVFDLPHSKTNP